MVMIDETFPGFIVLTLGRSLCLYVVMEHGAMVLGPQGDDTKSDGAMKQMK